MLILIVGFLVQKLPGPTSPSYPTTHKSEEGLLYLSFKKET
jgi:hypothetical protein